MSPRRSSRARVEHPMLSQPKVTDSSTSSASSARGERNSRSHNKASSPNRFQPTGSQSLEDPDDSTKPQLRRTRSGHDEIKDIAATGVVDEDDDDEEEEEVTRCICGNTEYPGLPTPPDETYRPSAKANGEPNTSSEVVPEDAGGLFIQCDICKVWQHGGCVGILDEGMSPDEYFCEQCRKDLHRITVNPAGQKYSRYLPVQKDHVPAATSPVSGTRDTLSRKAKDTRASRPSAEALAHKRRLTMNSRDAAYDEAEQLRRAIEESKKEGGTGVVENGTRRSKRSRSDSEERKEDAKRQRTTSDSSTASRARTLVENGDSEEEGEQSTKPQETGLKKIRGAAARNMREKESRVREKERVEVSSGRRKGRTERRGHGGEISPSADPHPRAPSTKDPDTFYPTAEPAQPHSPSSSRPSPDTSQNPHPQTTDNSLPSAAVTTSTPTAPAPKPTHHKKTGRPPTRARGAASGGGRVGRNHYTGRRGGLEPSSSHTNGNLDVRDPSPNGGRARSRSRSNTRGEGATPLLNGGGWASGEGVSMVGSGPASGGGRGGKGKYLHPTRTSMAEMKRRVASILEFVIKGQTEIPGRSRTVSAKTTSPAGTPNNKSGGGGSGEGSGIQSRSINQQGSNSASRSHQSKSAEDLTISKGGDVQNQVPVQLQVQEQRQDGNELMKGVIDKLQGIHNPKSELGIGSDDSSSKITNDFLTMNPDTMMENLSGRLVQWQTEFGK